MLIALIALTVAFNFAPESTDDDSTHALTSIQGVILSAMLLYIGGYQIGFGPISWLLISEVYTEYIYIYMCVCVYLYIYWMWMCTNCCIYCIYTYIYIGISIGSTRPSCGIGSTGEFLLECGY